MKILKRLAFWKKPPPRPRLEDVIPTLHVHLNRLKRQTEVRDVATQPGDQNVHQACRDPVAVPDARIDICPREHDLPMGPREGEELLRVKCGDIVSVNEQGDATRLHVILLNSQEA